MCDDHAERISVDWEFPSGMYRLPRKVETMIDVPVNLAMLTTKGWVPIAWPRAEINQRHAPPFTLKGQPLKLISTEAHCVMQPSQLWLWLADEQGNRWHVTVEYRDGGVRARVLSEPTSHSSAPAP